MADDGGTGSKEQVEEGALTATLSTNFRELLEGPPVDGPTWITSGGPDKALYGSIEDLNAEQASRDVNGTTLAAHVEHIRWALQLVNDFFDGIASRPDWTESWDVREVDSDEWRVLRESLTATGNRLLDNIENRQKWGAPMAMNGAFVSLAHTAYHLGAIRQLRKAVTGN